MHGRRGSAALAGVLVVVSMLAAGRAAAAMSASAPSAAVESIGGGIELTIASLQERARRLEGASGDEASSEALREYQSAIDLLGQAAEWRRRAQALERLQREAPRLLESTREELDAWSRQVPRPITADVSPSELETALAEAEAKLAVQRNALGDVGAELALLSDRRLKLPAEIAAAGAQREGTLGEFALPPMPTGSFEATLARRASALARKRAAGEQVAALELEIATQEQRRELLSVQRDLMRRKSDAYSARVAELQGALAERRLREAEKTAADARADQASLAHAHPVLGELAEENARLAAERTGDDGLTAKIDATTRQLSSVGDRLQRLQERSAGVRQKVAAAGLTDAIGLLLRKERAELPPADRTRADIRLRRDQISFAQLQALELEDTLKALPALEDEVEGILAAQADAPGVDRARVEASARGVLQTRRTYLESLIRDYNAWFASLVDLDAKETQLAALIDDYRTFLEQHVLWIPNATLPSAGHLERWGLALRWLADPDHLAGALRRLVATARWSPVSTTAGVLLLLVVLAYRRRLKALYAALCEQRSVPEGFPLPAPAAALVACATLALPGPFALWFTGSRIVAAPTPPDDFSRALAIVLVMAAKPLFAGEFLRRATAERGLAAAFFEWPRAALASLRTQVVLIETIALPAFAVAVLFDVQPQPAWSETVGRAAFCFSVGVIGVALSRLLVPDGGAVRRILRRTDLEWLWPALDRVPRLPLVVAVVLIVVALAGYYYSAFVLVERLWLSTLVLAAFVAANAATLRWLATRNQAPLAGEHDVGGVAPGAEGSVAEAVSRVSAQTRSLLRVLFGLGLFVGLFSVWADVFPALRFFESVELWQVASTVEKTVGAGDAAHVELVPVTVPVTVANLLLALVGMALAVVGARNLPGLLELALLSRLGIDRALRYAIATVTRYVVFVAGAVFALENLGVSWSKVQWLVAAVSVGLGFGLQEIFGNFVSGLIILFERPVRVGDVVTIDGVTGTVSRIEMRATSIVDFDRKELIVPNKDLITGKLLNWSLQDPIVRLVVPVGVAYGSDTALVERILLDAAKQCPTVLENPPAVAAFTGFGDSALDFELRVFLTSPDALVASRHQVLTTIDRRFRAAGIEIPFPQRDLHVRTMAAGAAATVHGNDGGRGREESHGASPGVAAPIAAALAEEA